jgi:hypothetical protein
MSFCVCVCVCVCVSIYIYLFIYSYIHYIILELGETQIQKYELRDVSKERLNLNVC